MSENAEIYTAGKNFTLPPAVTTLTNSTSVFMYLEYLDTYKMTRFVEKSIWNVWNQIKLGRYSNNQNGNLRWFFPWGGGWGGLEFHLPILKNDFF